MPETQIQQQQTQMPDETALPTSPEKLLKQFDDLNITYDLVHHKAVFTVAESKDVDAQIPGTHCRNMFLRDKKKRMFLVSLANETEVDLKKLDKLLECGRLSFGSADRLWGNLGVRPGSVCPYAIINDGEKKVTLILDAWMMEQKRVNFHPLLNTMTVGMAPKDIIKFVESIDHPYQVLDLSDAKPD